MGALLGTMATHACAPTSVVHRRAAESESRPRVAVSDPRSEGQIEVKSRRIAMENGEAIGISNVRGGPDRARCISDSSTDVTPVVPFGRTCPQEER
jgi:hypothetical protein